MTQTDLIALSPLIVLSATAVAVMLAIAWRRHHLTAAGVTVFGLAATLASLNWASSVVPRQVGPLLVVDGYALFYTGLLCAASLLVTALAYTYFEPRKVAGPTSCTTFCVLKCVRATFSNRTCRL